MKKKLIPGVSRVEMDRAFSVKVYTEIGVHCLAVLKEDGSFLEYEDGTPVIWSNGRTYGQLTQNGQALVTKYDLRGGLDTEEIVRK